MTVKSSKSSESKAIFFHLWAYGIALIGEMGETGQTSPDNSFLESINEFAIFVINGIWT